MFRSDGAVLRSRFEVPIREKEVVVFDPETDHQTNLHSFFGDWHGSTVLCACGSLVHIDQVSVNRRRMMGKPVECSCCRNQRVALEREDLDMEFYDHEGE